MSVFDDRLVINWQICQGNFDFIRLFVNTDNVDGVYFDIFDYINQYLRKLDVGSETPNHIIQMSEYHN